MSYSPIRPTFEDFDNNLSNFLRHEKSLSLNIYTDDFTNGLKDWKFTNGIGIDNNELTMLSASELPDLGNIAFYNKDNARSIEITLGSVTPNNARIVFCVDEKNCCFIAKSSTNLNLYRLIDGNFSFATDYVLTSLTGVAPANFVTGDRIKCVIHGQHIQYFLNDVLLGTFALDMTKGLTVPVNKPLKAGVLFISYANRFTVTNATIRTEKGKYIHFSMDDTIDILQTITNNQATYDSIFQHPTFAYLKSMHDKYGITFTFNVFYVNATGTWNITQMTNKFRQELALNSDWLKFAFHAYNNLAKYDASGYSATDAGTHYTNVINEIKRFAYHDNIDTVIRSGFYTGTVEVCRAWKNLGVKGFLSSNAVEPAPYNYYLTTTQRDALAKCDDYYDSVEGLYFVKTDGIYDYVDDPVSELESQKSDIAYSGQRRILEIFTHGKLQNLSEQIKMTNTIKWAIKNGYEFGFAIDNLTN